MQPPMKAPAIAMTVSRMVASSDRRDFRVAAGSECPGGPGAESESEDIRHRIQARLTIGLEEPAGREKSASSEGVPVPATVGQLDAFTRSDEEDSVFADHIPASQ